MNTNEMASLDYESWCATRKFYDDLRAIPNSLYDDCPSPVRGFTYEGGFEIELHARTFSVWIGSQDFSGTLQECEHELWTRRVLPSLESILA